LTKLNKIDSFLKTLYTNLLQPKSKNYDSRRREFLLNVLLLGSILLLGFLNGFVIYDKLSLGLRYEGISPEIFLGILFIFICLYILSRTGRFIQSSYILIGIYFVSISFAAYHWGVDLPTALLGFAMLISISSVLINTRFGLIITLMVSVFIITIGSLESAAIIHPIKEWKTQTLKYDDAVEYAVVLLVIMIVSWLSNRETERSLERARRSEKALMAERDLLELKVEERAGELRQLQMRRITELHHLAEMGKSAGGFFHDLMNPLTGLVLAVERLNSGSANNKLVVSEQLDKALAASRHMEKFITAIRRHGSIAPAEETLPLQAELGQVIQLLEYKARKNGVRLELKIEDAAAPGQAPVDFYKIAYNLISYGIMAASNFSANPDKAVGIKLGYSGATIKLEVTYPGGRIPALESPAPAEAKF
jgi:signal transduction histidine kinase